MGRVLETGLAAIVLSLSCVQAVRRPAPSGPDEAVQQFWQALTETSSFAFSLRYHTDTPFALSADYTGVRQDSDREAWNGEWRRGNERSRVALRGAGPVQYERDGSIWRRAQRGLETRVLEQAGAVLRGAKFRHTGTLGRRYTYEFKPEVPIIDPAQSMKLSGRLDIDAGNGLPVRVHCHDSAGRAEWELRLGRFGRSVRIDVPFQPIQAVDAVPVRRLSRAEWSMAARVLEGRLAAIGVEHRLRRSGAGLQLELDRAFSSGQLDLLLSVGNLEIWTGSRAQDSMTSDTSLTVSIGGDVARRYRLVQRVAGGSGIQLKPRLELPVDPKVEVLGVERQDAAFDHGVALLLSDGEALAAAVPGTSGELLFRDLGNEDVVRIVCALGERGPLPSGFRIAGRP